MAQVLTFPRNFDRTFSFVRPFQELPLHREIVAGEPCYAGLCDGEFEIEHDGNGNWQMAGLWLRIDNLKNGEAAKAATVPLCPDRHENLMLTLYGALERQYGRSIDAWVSEHLDEMAA